MDINGWCCGEISDGDLIDVRTFGPRYQYGVESLEFAGCKCPWHYVVQCKHGTIGPSGGDKLWANCRKAIRKAVIEWTQTNGIEIKQDTGKEVSFEFSVDMFREVAGLLQPL